MIQLSLSISDVIMDVILLAFPIPLVGAMIFTERILQHSIGTEPILRLQMTPTSKLAVLGIFTLGALYSSAVAASITRLVIIVEELNVTPSDKHKVEFQATADEDFVSTAGTYFMFIEACFGLTAVCLPSLSGALNLKGVQTVIEGFQSAFSNSSRSSLGSNRSRSHATNGDKHGRLDSARSNSVPASERPSQADTPDIGMYPLPKDQNITVTSRLDMTSESTKPVPP
ncbi:integral membrane protein [Rutstroemia sp. NJR-2017a WRK4]|nr:integral membrane protein [Rutstroemia sp. NJR-2017a WRK4]